MYKFSYFQEENPEIVLEFMQKYSFTILTGFDETYPVATHVPLDVKVINDKIIFTGHMMKNTDHHKAFEKNDNVLVIFNGPHCYVSAQWYTTQNVASTWNYIAVHAKGKISFTDEPSTKNIIEQITGKYEIGQSAAAFKNLPEKYVDGLVKAIIGFTIEVESIDNVFKLSQNHNEADRLSIIHNLRKRSDDDSRVIAEEMEKRITL
jgi:transcriptional regulator